MPQHGDVFTLAQAEAMRNSYQAVHNQMRAILNDMARENPVQPTEADPWTPKRLDVPYMTPWRVYLARHKEGLGFALSTPSFADALTRTD